MAGPKCTFSGLAQWVDPVTALEVMEVHSVHLNFFVLLFEEPQSKLWKFDQTVAFK